MAITKFSPWRNPKWRREKIGGARENPEEIEKTGENAEELEKTRGGARGKCEGAKELLEKTRRS
jgi:hypothetical protein